MLNNFRQFQQELVFQNFFIHALSVLSSSGPPITKNLAWTAKEKHKSERQKYFRRFLNELAERSNRAREGKEKKNMCVNEFVELPSNMKSKKKTFSV